MIEAEENRVHHQVATAPDFDIDAIAKSFEDQALITMISEELVVETMDAVVPRHFRIDYDCTQGFKIRAPRIKSGGGDPKSAKRRVNARIAGVGSMPPSGPPPKATAQQKRSLRDFRALPAATQHKAVLERGCSLRRAAAWRPAGAASVLGFRRRVWAAARSTGMLQRARERNARDARAPLVRSRRRASQLSMYMQFRRLPCLPWAPLRSRREAQTSPRLAYELRTSIRVPHTRRIAPGASWRRSQLSLVIPRCASVGLGSCRRIVNGPSWMHAQLVEQGLSNVRLFCMLLSRQLPCSTFFIDLIYYEALAAAL